MALLMFLPSSGYEQPALSASQLVTMFVVGLFLISVALLGYWFYAAPAEEDDK